jgi:3-hydroxyacyl-CoA dehydrogenase
MDTVEIIKGEKTDETTMAITEQLVLKIGKLPIRVIRDVPGFVVNRVLAPIQVLLGKIVENGIATHNQVDAMARKMAQPMGPFEMMDFGHLDLSLQVVTSLHETYGERFLPPQSLINLVKSGYLGRRTGRGWYHYPEEKEH